MAGLLRCGREKGRLFVARLYAGAGFRLPGGCASLTTVKRGEGSVGVKDFLEGNASGVVVVAKLPLDIQTHLKAKTMRVLLSSDTRDSHQKHRWTSEDFDSLQEILDSGEVRTDRDKHVVVAHLHGVWRCAILKVTGNLNEVYLSSLHRMRKKQVIDFPTKGNLVREARKL
ncbi:hypothetical protein M5E06_22465 [Azospirillum sp. A1-3]|uniref:hypothetical protein n=1 Tax=Azospirillum sp. A1-3 TaxID=185874 RepID=UPI002076FCD2|nr:hypothetical protein [Azospirillum sp. A1-3]MCM8736887.1 hypothetical protein [Azospirillum sp. A1-3]